MTETYPEFEIGTEVEVIASDDFIRGEVIGINYTCPLYMYIIHLNRPFEGEFGQQTGLYVPESSLISEPDIENLVRTVVGTYVCLTENGALDVSVMVATTDDEDVGQEYPWYVILVDSIEGTQYLRFSPFDTQDEATLAAKLLIEENHEAAPDEDAEQYLARIQAEGDNG